MKGKKTDFNFITEYINKCLEANISTNESIVNKAKEEISIIDDKIKEIELLKKKRCQLIDVVNFLDVKHKKDNISLKYYNLHNQHICKYICDSIKEKSVEISSLKEYDISDIFFSIKQLIELKILVKNKDCIMHGDMYHDYMNFLYSN